MSFDVASLGTVGDTNGRSAYTCSVNQSPDPNTLVLVAVLAADAAGTVVEPTDVSGLGITFSLITSSITFNPTTGGSQVHNLSAWRGMTGSPVSSLVTATFSNSQNGCSIQVIQVSGVSQAGTNGDKAVGKSANSVVNNTSALTIIAPSATSTANAWLSFNGHGTSGQASPSGNYSQIDFANHLTPSSALMSAWTTLSTGTIVGWTTAGTEFRAGVLIELVLDNPTVAVGSAPGAIGRRFRIPEVPSQITGTLGQYLRQVAKQLNAEGFISLFSGADPNVSGFTGIPGNLVVNIGSASTWTRLWVQAGSVASVSTTSWHPLRTA